ncbi:MAG: hypothetical protein EZS28_029243 [Streblomastix strix]|uniref:Uncharacterized protein n=1 Tax=Streblomastix strix TaxID=222440 RepID=A0A5J4UZD5_9EUKA|nr:MAG: hypothetical protein EZS28_029243 [Streblomastix strix]
MCLSRRIKKKAWWRPSKLVVARTIILDLIIAIFLFVGILIPNLTNIISYNEASQMKVPARSFAVLGRNYQPYYIDYYEHYFYDLIVDDFVISYQSNIIKTTTKWPSRVYLEVLHTEEDIRTYGQVPEFQISEIWNDTRRVLFVSTPEIFSKFYSRWLTDAPSDTQLILERKPGFETLPYQIELIIEEYQYDEINYYTIEDDFGGFESKGKKFSHPHPHTKQHHPYQHPDIGYNMNSNDFSSHPTIFNNIFREGKQISKISHVSQNRPNEYPPSESETESLPYGSPPDWYLTTFNNDLEYFKVSMDTKYHSYDPQYYIVFCNKYPLNYSDSQPAVNGIDYSRSSNSDGGECIITASEVIVRQNTYFTKWPLIIGVILLILSLILVPHWVFGCCCSLFIGEGPFEDDKRANPANPSNNGYLDEERGGPENANARRNIANQQVPHPFVQHELIYFVNPAHLNYPPQQVPSQYPPQQVPSQYPPQQVPQQYPIQQAQGSIPYTYSAQFPPAIQF